MAKQCKDVESLIFFPFQNSMVSKSILGTSIAKEKKWGDSTFSWLHHSKRRNKNNFLVAPLLPVQPLPPCLHDELSSPLGLLVSLPPFTTKTHNPFSFTHHHHLCHPSFTLYLPLLILWILLWFDYYVRARVYFVILVLVELRSIKFKLC